MSIDLPGDQLDRVRRILAEHVPECEVWVFGSRVHGTRKRFSDLDLALVSSQPLPPRRLALLAEAFAESDLPFKVDVIDLASASQDLRRRIEDRHEILSHAASAGPSPQR